MSHIIQWNCRGFRANYEETQLLLQQLNPVAICLQETKIKTDINIKHYTSYFKHVTGDIAHGGVMISVRSNTPHSSIPIITGLQAVAVRVSLH